MEIKKVVFIKQVELEAWGVALLALVWVVCKERNRRQFEGIENAL